MTRTELKAKLIKVLKNNQDAIGPLFDFDLNNTPLLLSDSSKSNEDLQKVDTTDPKAYTNYAKQLHARHNAVASVGGYLEERVIYRGRPLFDQDSRCIHLGIDINTKPGTPIFTPLESTVHSFADNKTNGDYGPTIILEHQIEDLRFYTLYGHLSRNSLIGLHSGMHLPKSSPFAQLGTMSENGQWPPHLHFQIVLDMLNYTGDFPGVCSKEELEHYKNICPDPNLILRIDMLNQKSI